MEFATAIKICRDARLAFARPASWSSWRRGHALDLAGKLQPFGVVQEVHIGAGEGIFCIPFAITTDELVEDWVLISKEGLRREYQEMKELKSRRDSA